MAERRMFTQKITESDAFLEMPLSSQALYFHLCMSADDDGFVKNPKRIGRMIGSSDDDLKLLTAKSFVISYESGVIVIKHWRMHNLLRKDRYKPTEYVDEKSMLLVKENGAYTLDETQGIPVMATKWQPNGNQMAPQYSIGKDSIGKDNIYNSAAKNAASKKFVKPTVDEVKEYCKERNNTVDAETFIDFYESKDWYVGKNKMKDWKAAVRTWERSRTNKQQSNQKPGFKVFQQSNTDNELDELEKMFLNNINS